MLERLLALNHPRCDTASSGFAPLWKRRAYTPTAKQNVAGAIIVNYLLDNLPSIAFASCANLGVS